jgi:hypothetical protein
MMQVILQEQQSTTIRVVCGITNERTILINQNIGGNSSASADLVGGSPHKGQLVEEQGSGSSVSPSVMIASGASRQSPIIAGVAIKFNVAHHKEVRNGQPHSTNTSIFEVLLVLRLTVSIRSCLNVGVLQGSGAFRGHVASSDIESKFEGVDREQTIEMDGTKLDGSHSTPLIPPGVEVLEDGLDVGVDSEFVFFVG